MKHLQTEISIEAPAAIVWDILMDFHAYPDWNPFIQQIEGPAGVGERLRTQIQLEGRKPMGFKPRVLVHQVGKEFRWVGRLWMPGLFDGEHYFQLEEAEAGNMRFVHGEQFRGLLVGVLMGSLAGPTEAGFRAMNEALKKRAEARVQ